MDQIGDYLVRRLLGQGGMGRVYEGEERLSGRRVALKVLLPELAASDEGRRLFLNEMRVLARLEHPNLVRSLASFEADGQLVLVLEYLEGRTLRDVVSAGRMPWGEAALLVAGIASALAAIHAQSPPVVHRDLKPENVMVLPGGAVKVMDFGIAKVLEALQRTHTHSVGTLQYMSPEQIDARGLDGRSDLYCLGLIFYELLAGEPPFRSPSPRELLNLHCTAPPPPLRDEVRRGLPKGLEALLFQLLEKSPQARPASANEVLGRLEPFLPAVSSALAPPAAASALPSAAVMTSPPYDPTLPSPRPEGATPGAPFATGATPGAPFAAGAQGAGHVTGAQGAGHATGAPLPARHAAPSPAASGAAGAGGQRAPSNDTLALLEPAKGRMREAPRGLGVAIIVVLTLLAGGVGYWLRASSGPPADDALERPVGRAP
ncbi:MAG TPA: serine/threonine-protein kinase [Polyangiaceae bacterium]|nr:serine/threonine-protein kinase [Polyangiaceae bacterium]